jgi:hypothetical protein
MNVHYQAWGLVAKVPVLQDRLYGFLREFHSQRAESVESAVREGQRRGFFQPDVDAGAFAGGFQALLSGFLYRATFDPEALEAALQRRRGVPTSATLGTPWPTDPA